MRPWRAVASIEENARRISTASENDSGESSSWPSRILPETTASTFFSSTEGSGFESEREAASTLSASMTIADSAVAGRGPE